MAKERNPYINNMSLEEVAHAESSHYYLQVGDEVAEFNGRHTFSKDKAEWLFSELLHSMRHMVRHGEAADKKTALIGLRNFRLHPLRIH